MKLERSSLLIPLKNAMNASTMLSMNGIFSITSNLFPFVLSSSKDSERVFQQLLDQGQLRKTNYVGRSATGTPPSIALHFASSAADFCFAISSTSTARARGIKQTPVSSANTMSPGTTRMPPT